MNTYFGQGRRTVTSTFVFCVALAITQPACQPSTLSDTRIRVRVDTVAHQIIADGAPSVAIGVVYQGRPMTFTYGEVREGSHLQANSKTVYEIGSVTKSFTAMVLAILVERGVVRLNDSAETYMPADVRLPDYRGHPIRLEDLATHTAGLPRAIPLHGRSTSDFEMFDFVNHYQLPRSPGEGYEYSNLGFALLAHALAFVEHTSWEELIEREVCGPLEMADTRVSLSGDEKNRAAQGYTEGGTPAPDDLPTWPAFTGSGALRSTLDDMMRYLQFNMGLTDVRLKSVLPILQTGRRPAPDGEVGLAWQMSPLWSGSALRIIHKNGETAGFGAYIGFVTDTRTGVVLLVNRAGMDPDPKAIEILRLLNGEMRWRPSWNHRQGNKVMADQAVPLN